MDDAGILPARHRLDVVTYHRMAEAGIFGEDDRIELIDGDLIGMAPIGSDHAANVNALIEALVVASAGRAIVSAQNPIRLDRSSEPQPDLAILPAAPISTRARLLAPPMCCCWWKCRIVRLLSSAASNCRSMRGRGSRNTGSWI